MQHLFTYIFPIYMIYIFAIILTYKAHHTKISLFLTSIYLTLFQWRCTTGEDLLWKRTFWILTEGHSQYVLSLIDQLSNKNLGENIHTCSFLSKIPFKWKNCLFFYIRRCFLSRGSYSCSVKFRMNSSYSQCTVS